MAVYTLLDEGALQQMLSVYDVGQLERYDGIAAGSINTSYRVTTTRGVWYLRINENKPFRALVYEKNLLLWLRARAARLGGVKTPVVVENVIGGHFFPLHKRYACLFEELKGRELAVFEVAPEHVRQVGAFLARAHVVARAFRGGRANPFGLPTLQRWLDDVGRRARDRALARRLRRALDLIAARRRPLPRGVVHGDLFMNNTKWRHGDLDAVFDWEMAGRDQLMLDVGICLNAWCFRREERALDLELCAALLDGYASVRPLSSTEARGLFVETCLGALRFTLSRIRDFELGRDDGPPDAVTVPLAEEQRAPSSAKRDYLDYREYEARLDAWQAMGPRRFRELSPSTSGARRARYRGARFASSASL